MGLIIYAPNINSGGGNTLLVALLKHIAEPVILQIDDRFDNDLKPDKYSKIFRVRPNLFSRLAAEVRLLRLCKPGDKLLCFGNLPPLFVVPASVTVYIQNRYLVDPKAIKFELSKQTFKLLIEKMWLKVFIRNSSIYVQTQTMKLLTEKFLKMPVRIMPFFPTDFEIKRRKAKPKYDYLYVATGEEHKNHRRLISVWLLLASKNIYPSLRLTLCKTKDSRLFNWIEQQARAHQLNIVMHPVSQEKIADLYAESGALVYPSLFESFGLPLLEAKANNLPILASERDYVRDLVEPDFTFDPVSERSILRAILRYEGKSEKLISPKDEKYILQSLLEY